MRITLGIGLCAAIVSFSAGALAEPKPPVFQCFPTPALGALPYPGAPRIPNTNRLIQPAGKALPYDGQILVVQGRVYDSRCVPVKNAEVELWQADPFGRLQLATGEDLVNPKPVFTGAGRTYTEEDGEFTFITAFPGFNKGAAPTLSIRLSAPNQPTLSTRLYFANDARNARDVGYKRLKDSQRAKVTMEIHPRDPNDPEGPLLATIKLVMAGKATYQGY